MIGVALNRGCGFLFSYTFISFCIFSRFLFTCFHVVLCGIACGGGGELGGKGVKGGERREGRGKRGGEVEGGERREGRGERRAYRQTPGGDHCNLGHLTLQSILSHIKLALRKNAKKYK